MKAWGPLARETVDDLERQRIAEPYVTVMVNCLKFPDDPDGQCYFEQPWGHAPDYSQMFENHLGAAVALLGGTIEWSANPPGVCAHCGVPLLGLHNCPPF